MKKYTHLLLVWALLMSSLGIARDFNSSEEIRLLPAAGEGVQIGTGGHEIRVSGGVLEFSNDGVAFDPLGAGGLAKWTTGEDYAIDDVVWDPTSDGIYAANTAHTAGATFAGDLANWDELSPGADITGKLDKFPAELNDNRLVRTDTDGNAVQGSGVTLDDSDGLSGVVDLTMSGDLTVDTDLLVTDGTANTVDIVGLLDVDNLRLDGNTISSQDVNGNIILDPNGTGQVNFPDLTVSTPAYIDADGDLVAQDLSLTADVSGVLPVANGGTNSSAALNNNRVMVASGGAIVEHSALTSTHLIYADANGLPAGSANNAWDNATSTQTIAGIFNIDNLRMDLNTLSSTNANGDILLDPNGTGAVKKLDSSGNQYVVGSNNHDVANLLLYPSFEESVAEGACTGCTASAENSVVIDGLQSLEIAFSAASGEYLITKNTGSEFSNVPMVAQCWIKTSAADVTFQVETDGVDVNGGSIDVVTADIWAPYTIGPFVSGTTSTAIKVVAGSSITDSIFIDKCAIQKHDAGTRVADINSTQVLQVRDRAGNGSTTNKVPYFTNVLKDTGPRYFSYVNNSTDGFYIQANRDIENITVVYHAQNSAGELNVLVKSSSANYATDKAASINDGSDSRYLGAGNASSTYGKTAVYSGPLLTGEIIYGRYSGGTPTNAGYMMYITATDTDENIVTPSRVKKQNYEAHTHAGMGSTATQIPYFSSVSANTGDTIATIANNSTDGLTVTALEDCVVDVSFSYTSQTSEVFIGISVDGTPTTSVDSLAGNLVRMIDQTKAANRIGSVSYKGPLRRGQVLRPHTSDAGGSVSANAVFAHFNIELRTGNEALEATLVGRTAVFNHTQASTVAGGTATTGAWTAVPINTTTTGQNFATRSSTSVTLEKGLYRIYGWQEFYNTDRTGLRLRQTSGSAATLATASGDSSSTDSNAIQYRLFRELEIDVPTTIELQYYVTTGASSGALGRPMPDAAGETNTYGGLEITKIR